MSIHSPASTQPKQLSSGEGSAPALSKSMQRGTIQEAVSSHANITSSLQQATGRPSQVFLTRYAHDLPSQRYALGDEGQPAAAESSFCEPPAIHMQSRPQQSPPLLSPPLAKAGETNFFRPQPPSQARQQENLSSSSSHLDEQGSRMASFESDSPPLNQKQAIPLNPDYSTLEYVPTSCVRAHPPRAPAPTTTYHHFLQQLPPHLQQQVQHSMPFEYQHQQMWHRQGNHMTPILEPQINTTDLSYLPAEEHIPQHRVCPASR